MTMRYRMNLGRLAINEARVRHGQGPFRLAVLADLSGRGNLGTVEIGTDLQQRRPWKVDVDNLDSVLQRMGLKLRLPVGDAGSIDVDVECIDDLHPDELYEKLDVFGELNELRRRLKNPSTFPDAAKEVNQWSQSAPHQTTVRSVPKSAGTSIPRGKLSDFARLIEKEVPSTPARSITDQLTRCLVTPPYRAGHSRATRSDDCRGRRSSRVCHACRLAQSRFPGRRINLALH